MIKRAFEFKEPVEQVEGEAPEPVELTLGKYTIQCIPVEQCDGLQLLSYFAAMRSTTYSPGDRTAAVIKWLRAVIPTTEFTKFEAASAHYSFEVEDVAAIAAELAEVYGNRPTTPAASSSDGQSAGGSSSEDNSDSAESTPRS